MKKLGFLIPLLMFLGLSLFLPRLFTGGAGGKGTMVLFIGLFVMTAFLFRPKNKGARPVSDVEAGVRGEFAKDAFADDPQHNARFQSALKDYSQRMPKSALNKLNKLAQECSGDREQYAISMALALCAQQQQNYKEAIRHYNKALLLHPTAELAMTVGSVHQRLGELRKARDSYEFALDLDDSCIEARSRIATTHVADGNYDTALEQAERILEQDASNASALATAAICSALTNDPVMANRYRQLAVENGYSEKKITETISALKKRQ
ncbi:MAG: tetratricopeptide repeat protein [Oscillospiraceae bacterium]|nr:tetratricopeptide repeat protein [Oscillospiraceae bacterium]